MKVNVEFDLDTERSLYDDVLALQKYYGRGDFPCTLMWRKLTPSEQKIFSCKPGSAAEEFKATALLKIWEDEAEKEGRFKSVVEDIVNWANGIDSAIYALSVFNVITTSLVRRKIDMKLDDLKGTK